MLTLISRSPFLLIVGYALLIVLYFPWISMYEIDPDEGLNLAKAALASSGYDMYREIWSDQPPLLTYALAALQHLWPSNVFAARLLILLSACLLLASLYDLVKRSHGPWAAVFALLLLMTSPLFLKLSVSVMVGLPAISLAVLAMAMAARPGDAKHFWAFLAGIVFACSLQTKFIAALLGPVIILMLWLGRPDQSWPCKVRATATFIAAACISFALIALVAGDAFIEQLIYPHFETELRDAHSFSQSAQEIWRVLRRQSVLFVLALLGIWLLRQQVLRQLLPAIAWLLITIGALLFNHPVWFHQPLLVLPALAWIAGAGVIALYSKVLSHSKMAAPMVLVGVAALCVTQAVTAVKRPKEDDKVALGNAVRDFAPLGGWVVTDSPIDAFRAGLLVPPNLAVYSYKRWLGGNLTAEDVVATIDRLQPQQVAFRRFAVHPTVKAYLAARYISVPTWGSAAHYISKGQDPPFSPEQKAGLLNDMSAEFARTAVRGHYASAFSLAQGKRFAESLSRPLNNDEFWMRPPGSAPRAGACFLRSYQLSGQQQYLDWAIEVARAVSEAQLCTGGWSSKSGELAKCRQGSIATPGADLDEGMTAEAIAFLLELKTQTPAHASWIDPTILDALDFLVGVQNAQGAWPYGIQGKRPYVALSTLNDDITTMHIRVLLQGYQVYGRDAHLQSAKRGIEFLLRAQSPSGAWAQQYDSYYRPAAGRPFEPAAWATIESAFSIQTLIAFDQMFPSVRVQEAIKRGSRWLKRVMISPGQWARFHDVRDGASIYQDRNGRRYQKATDLPAEDRESYRVEGAFGEVARAILLADAYLAGGKVAHAREAKRLDTIAIRRSQADAIRELTPLIKAGDTSLARADGLIWTKDFIDRCKLVHAIWHADDRQVGAAAVHP